MAFKNIVDRCEDLKVAAKKWVPKCYRLISTLFHTSLFWKTAPLLQLGHFKLNIISFESVYASIKDSLQQSAWNWLLFFLSDIDFVVPSHYLMNLSVHASWGKHISKLRYTLHIWLTFMLISHWRFILL